MCLRVLFAGVVYLRVRDAILLCLNNGVSEGEYAEGLSGRGMFYTRNRCGCSQWHFTHPESDG